MTLCIENVLDEERNPVEEPPSTSSLSTDELNKLNAKILKAELMGDEVGIFIFFVL